MKVSLKEEKFGDSIIASWSGLAAEEDGSDLNCAFLKVGSVAFEWDFGGAVAVLEGRVTGEYMPLISPTGGTVSSGNDAMLSVSGRHPFIRPRIIGGNKETNITVSVFCDTVAKRRLGQ